MRSRLAVLLAAVVVVLAGCSSGAASPSVTPATPVASVPASAAAAELTVFGAASLKGVLDKTRRLRDGISRHDGDGLD
jgi:ABC-type molybdate transport system substrate-binding protein